MIVPTELLGSGGWYGDPSELLGSGGWYGVQLVRQHLIYVYISVCTPSVCSLIISVVLCLATLGQKWCCWKKKNTSQYTPVPKTWIFNVFDQVFIYQLKKVIGKEKVSHVCLFRFAVPWKHSVSVSNNLVIDHQWRRSRWRNLNYSSSKGAHMRLWFMLAMGQSYVLMKGESYALMTNLITPIMFKSVKI